jgi:hypothetical protein
LETGRTVEGEKTMNLKRVGALRARGCVVVGAGLCGVAAAPASAFYFGTRFVERIGNTDVVLGDSVTFEAGSTHRLRMQFGVFDDDNSAAPSGGYIGWNVGTFSADFGSWTRTPGRLNPFTFAPFPYSNGVPEVDPFTELEQIDNTLGHQAIPWFCDPNGEPTEPPAAVVRGRNEFISTYEVTVNIPAGLEGAFDVTIGGNLLGVVWVFDQSLSRLPDCETGDPGFAFHRPLVTPVHPFTNDLRVNVVIPGPGVAGCLLMSLGLVARRRR